MQNSTSAEAEKNLSQIIRIDEGQVQQQLGEMVRSTVEETLNAMLDAEADHLCNAQRYERTEARTDQRAGHYTRKLHTKAGEVELKVPKLRRATFETAIIDRYRRRESSVEEALMEMYLAGVSVRRVEDITQAIIGSSIMERMEELEHRSIYIIREAYACFEKPAVLWSMGKDSTVLIALCRKAFLGQVPFPVIHIDTGRKFPTMYAFRDKWAKAWGLELLVARNSAGLAGNVDYADKLACCTALKTEALKQFICEEHFDALMLAIRRDEHGVRAKERHFSPRDTDFRWDYHDQPPELWDLFGARADGDTHIRVHPLLDWTELDIWRYIKQENLPVVDLYFSKEGKRYRSIGCEPCCEPVESDASTLDEILHELETTRIGERQGRAQDKEAAYAMQQLRALGYM